MSIHFKITSVNTGLRSELKTRLLQYVKLDGSLGQLEKLALKLGLVQNSLTPRLLNPTILVFAGDHGFVADTNATTERVHHFLEGSSAISVFARQNGLEFLLIDAGVNAELADHPRLLSCKVALGTQNFLLAPAMTSEQCIHAIKTGSRMALQQYMKGCNCLGFAEIGAENTLSAALLMHCLTDLTLEQCLELDNSSRNGQSLDILKQALAAHPHIDKLDPLAVLSAFGGFELAMMVGAVLRAAELGLLLIVDGFAASCALLVASTLYPEVLDYCIFSHVSIENRHRHLLAKLAVDPLLDLELHSNAGSGIALAYPLLISAELILNQSAKIEA